jgi:hypothetical protein
MFWDDHPTPLAEVECQDLLASVKGGRLSLTVGALPVIGPVTDWYLRGTVIVSMRDGPAQRAAVNNVVALEIDEANLEHALWAVLVIGRTIEMTHPEELAEAQKMGSALCAGAPPTHYLKLPADVISGYRTTRQ